MQEVRNERAFKYKRQFYILAIILITILFVYFLHIALYHCPKQNNVNQKKGEEGNQTGTSNPIKGYTPCFFG